MHNYRQNLIRTPGNFDQFWFICLLIVAATREILYFFAADATTPLNPIDYLLFALTIPYFLAVFRRSDSYTRHLVILLSALIVLFGLLGQWELGNLFLIDKVLKTLFPIILILVTASYQLRLSAFTLKGTAIIIAIFLLAAYLRIFGAQSDLDIIEVRHSTAYLLAGLTIVIWVSQLRYSTKLLILPLLVAPLLLLNVATVTIALAIFFSLEISKRWRLDTIFKFIFVSSLAVLVVLTRDNLLNLNSDEIGLLGSGRVAAWQDAISTFLSNGTFEQLFGQGSGSAYQFWGVWWWSEKDVHSDFLKILIENGFVVLIVLIVGLYGVNKRIQITNSIMSSILISAIATSVISNGVFHRPYASILWVLAFVIAGQSSQPKSQFSKSSDVLELPKLNRQNHSR